MKTITYDPAVYKLVPIKSDDETWRYFSPGLVEHSGEPLGFVEALRIAQAIFDAYKVDQPKWWKRMDGTPMLNDLPVRVATEMANLFIHPAPAFDQGGSGA